MKKILPCLVVAVVLLLGSASVLADPWPNPVTDSVTVEGTTTTIETDS